MKAIPIIGRLRNDYGRIHGINFLLFIFTYFYQKKMNKSTERNKKTRKDGIKNKFFIHIIRSENNGH